MSLKKCQAKYLPLTYFCFQSLEDDVKNYVSSAYFCLDHYPKEAPAVRRDMDEVQSKWNNLNKDIATHRDKLGNALEFHKTYKQVS